MTNEEFAEKVAGLIPASWVKVSTYPTGEALYRTAHRRVAVAIRPNPEEHGAEVIISEILRVAPLRFPKAEVHVTLRGYGREAVVFVGGKIAIELLNIEAALPPEGAAGISATCSGPLLRAVAALATVGAASGGKLSVPDWGGPWITAYQGEE